MEILKSNKSTILVLGKQEIYHNKVYRPLHFLLFSKIGNVSLVFNTLTKMLISVSAEELSCLKSEENFVSLVSRELIENWFLVPVSNNDADLSKGLFNTLTLLKCSEPPYINSYTILPTSDCNARCFYCFEADTQKTNMLLKTARNVVDFIKKNSSNHKVKIRWFGGEPLYNADAISAICEGLKASNIEFNSCMVSNGYLFNELIIKQAKEVWNLQQVQITLDGTESVYNRVKNYIYKDVFSPYKIVLNNIDNLLNNDISVRIRLNMDSYNADDLNELAKELVSRFGKYKNVSVDIRLLYENAGVYRAIRSKETRNMLANKLFNLKMFFINNNIGFKPRLGDGLKLSCCMADDDHSVVITPEGNITKCEHHFQDEIVGNINIGITNFETVKKWKTRIEKGDKCLDCPIYPLCDHLKNCPEFGVNGLQTYECKNLINTYSLAVENEFLSINKEN